MMSTPSSSSRIPPTSPQITASIIKFRCLYTHDLRRKSKRWHDGNLRYHTHNKRVMVYDDQGNFIGDHHWRSHDAVQDGDEMELDKGVLIEVTENMGTTETDISNLYEKKKSSQGSPQNQNPVSQVPRAPAVASTPRFSGGSSQSFRSLNELLGIKKNTTSHLASPYEQRNPPPPAVGVEQLERAPKRQKTTVVNTPANKPPRPQSQVIDLTDSTSAVPANRASNPLVKQAIRTAGNSAVASPANHQQCPVPSNPALPQGSDPSTLSGQSGPASSGPLSSLPSPRSLVRPAAQPVPPTRPLKSTPKAAPPMRSRGTSEVLSKNSSAGPLEKETTVSREILRVDHQPIGNESLSKDVPSNRTVPQPPVPLVSKNSHPITPNASVPRSTGDQSLPAELSRPLEAPRMHETATSREDRAQDTRSPVSSGGAVPPVSRNPVLTASHHPKSQAQSSVQPQRVVPPVSGNTPVASRPISDASAPAVSNNVQSTNSVDKAVPNNMPPPPRPLSTTRPLPAKSSDTPSGGLRMGVGKPRKKLMYSALLPGASRMPSPATSSSSRGDANKEPATEPQEPEKADGPAGPANSTASEEFMPSSSTQFIFDQLLDGSGLNPSPSISSNGRRSLDSPLRKSLSDPTTLAGLPGRTARSVNTNPIASEPMEQGAWTSEALDLFDFWPAGRPKPNERN